MRAFAWARDQDMRLATWQRSYRQPTSSTLAGFPCGTPSINTTWSAVIRNLHEGGTTCSRAYSTRNQSVSTVARPSIAW